MTPTRVLIVGNAWQRGTLAATRCLGRSGQHVSIASEVRGHAARSRYARQWFQTPAPDEPERLLDRVVALLAEDAHDVLFAGDDEHLLLLSEHRSRLEGVNFPYPPHGSILRGLDKVLLYDAAVRCGLTVPHVASSPAAITTDDEWISKPRMYRPGVSHSHVQVQGPVDGPGAEYDLIYQRVVDGALLAVVTLRGPDGRVIYLGAQRADAVFPEPFGVSVRARTVPVEPALADAVNRLLDELGWWGLAELQFIVPPSGTPHLIDLNGRFFGSLALTSAAGADLPSAWVAAATGQPVPADCRGRIGTRYQWLEGDLRRARAADAWTRENLRALRYALRATHSVWSPSDPRPALHHLAVLGRRGMRKATTR